MCTKTNRKQVWHTRFQELQNHLEANRQYPTEQDNPVLYRWVSQQRHKKKRGMMKSAKIKKLNSINFVWSQQEWKWNMMLGQLVEYCKTIELEPSKYTEPELWAWYRDQKKAMRKATLRQDRRDKISSIKFSGPPVQQKWLPVFEKLRQWRAANPRKWPHYDRNDKQSAESKLYIFCQQMRKRYRDNVIGEFWLKKLAGINFNFRGKADNWLSRYNEARELVARHNSVSVGVIGKKRYDWLLRHKKKLDEGKLSQNQAALIEQLQLHRFFVPWDTRFNQVKQWVEENGKLPTVKFHKDHHSWLSSQRSIYQNGNLSEEQTEKLRSIKFNYKEREKDYFEKKWLKGFHQYKNFLQKHGKEPSYKAPRSYNDKHEKRLCAWAMTQRAVMAGTARNHKPLSKERIDKLDSINFRWLVPGSSEKTWNESFERFKKHIRADGRLALHVKIDGKRNTTYSWWAGQKMAFRKGRLSAERIAEFKKAGIDFNTISFTSHIRWTGNTHKIAAFIQKNGRYPKKGNSREEDNMYQSLARTRRTHRAGKLSSEKLRLIKELNIKL